MDQPLRFQLGVKSDPILYRYSYGWLFRLMAEEDVHHLQLGTFCELYHLPDAFFTHLRDEAADHGIAISSVFTAHRELGGYFQGGDWVAVARRNHERLIAIAGLLGARSAGHNPGAVLRDRMGSKDEGWRTYLHHMEELLHVAARHGVAELTIEPMSCAAEPPCSPAEQRALMGHLTAYHQAHPGSAAPGYCIDIAHGWAGRDRQVLVDHWGLLEAGLPWCRELHLKNSDPLYDRTFGFREAERRTGVIDVAATAAWLRQRAEVLPVRELTGYLEISGPKLGRDYSDPELEPMLRESLAHLRSAWLGQADAAPVPTTITVIPLVEPPTVQLAPSLMCADQCHLEAELRRLESAGCEVLHIDVMDGAFTPNLVMGFAQVRALRPLTALPIDVHLMVEDNDLFVTLAKEAGADWITVHAESCRHLDRTLAAIRQLGLRAGVALNPATPVEQIRHVLHRLDHLLVMTVNPGFAGQALVPGALDKIAEVRAFLRQHGSAARIQVDGNVSLQHIPAMVAAGADILVCGSSSIFAADGSRADNVRRTREAVAAGLARRDAGSGSRPATAA